MSQLQVTSTVGKLVWQYPEAAGHIRSMLEAEGNQLMRVF